MIVPWHIFCDHGNLKIRVLREYVGSCEAGHPSTRYISRISDRSKDKASTYVKSDGLPNDGDVEGLAAHFALLLCFLFNEPTT